MHHDEGHHESNSHVDSLYYLFLMHWSIHLHKHTRIDNGYGLGQIVGVIQIP
jgi:hypothetical protein